MGYNAEGSASGRFRCLVNESWTNWRALSNNIEGGSVGSKKIKPRNGIKFDSQLPVFFFPFGSNSNQYWLFRLLGKNSSVSISSLQASAILFGPSTSAKEKEPGCLISGQILETFTFLFFLHSSGGILLSTLTVEVYEDKTERKTKQMYTVYTNYRTIVKRLLYRYSRSTSSRPPSFRGTFPSSISLAVMIAFLLYSVIIILYIFKNSLLAFL